MHEGGEELATEGGVELRLGLGEGGEQREARRVRQRLGQVPRVRVIRARGCWLGCKTRTGPSPPTQYEQVERAHGHGGGWG